MAQEIAPKVRLVDDAAFFAAWNLDTSGMERVRDAVQAGDLAAAKRELKLYFLQRRKPQWKISHWNMPTEPRGKAEQHSRYKEGEEVLAHRFSGGGFEVDFGDKIDWNYFPLRHEDGTPDTEYPVIHYINRFGHFSRVLGPLYWYSRDERYVREFVYEVTDHVLSNPAPENYIGGTAVWSRLTSCVPLSGSWLDAYNYFLPSETFTPEAHAIMLKGFIEKMRYAIRNPDGVNRYMAQLRGVFTCAAHFPELKQATVFREFAIKALCATVDDEFYPDGFSKELCPGYHGGSAGIIRTVVKNARQMGYDPPEILLKGLEAPYDVYAKIATPQMKLPKFGDTWGRSKVRRSLAAALPVLDKPLYRWFATNGKEGEPPAFRSTRFPWAGYYVMRSGWDPDAMYLCFDGGPLGTGHWHEDLGNFECFAFGEPLVTEVGIYSYTMSKWNRYFYSSLAHNVVTVDGLGQNRACQLQENARAKQPKQDDWHSCDVFDLAGSLHDGLWGHYMDCDRWRNKFGLAKAVSLATHRRDICFVKNSYWIISDRLQAPGKHSYAQLFHFEPDRTVAIHDERRAGSTDTARANLTFIQADPLNAQLIKGREEPLQGWCSLKQGEVCPAPVLSFECEAEDRMLYDTVLVPTRPGAEAHVQVTRLPVTDEAGATLPSHSICALRIETGSAVDYYINDLRQREIGPANGLVKIAGSIQTDARTAVIRLNAEGQITAVSAVGGTHLLINNTPVDLKQ
ncbi:MAG: alginate lyase family protein [Planctomycetes bacterium]|nr:alginate lyase family protein [Planctomycetota bacterium]